MQVCAVKLCVNKMSVHSSVSRRDCRVEDGFSLTRLREQGRVPTYLFDLGSLNDVPMIIMVSTPVHCKVDGVQNNVVDPAISEHGAKGREYNRNGSATRGTVVGLTTCASP